MSKPVLPAAFLSGVLLVLCFPKFSVSLLAWVALIPLLVAIRNVSSGREAWWAGFVTGLVFFGVTLTWMNYVAVVGWLFLSLLESVFLGFFALLVYDARRFRSPVLRSFIVALAWSLIEFFRSEVPVFGFGSNILAYSQAGNDWIRQAASLAGAYGLSFLIAWVNACLFETVIARRFTASLLLALAIFLGLGGYGYAQMRETTSPAGILRVSLIQGNIPQSVKWETMARDKIIEIHLALSKLANFSGTDLIIWPEAAFPGYFNRDAQASQLVEFVREHQVPLLFGSPHLEGVSEAYNSAYLMTLDGELKQRYDKQYLVPFGEYVPLQPFLGFLKPIAYSMGVSNFIAGTEPTIFRLHNDELHFSTLICFEDLFPGLARLRADQGAQFLAVMTNDAWFGPTAAPYQHLQASIFRAVENGVPVVRAANTGVSAFISKRGKVLGSVHDAAGNDTFIGGHATVAIVLDAQETLFRKGGWLFPYLAALLLAIISAMRKPGNGSYPLRALLLALPIMAVYGCIRMQAGASAWHQGSEDQSPHAHSIGFDTNDIVQRDVLEVD